MSQQAICAELFFFGRSKSAMSVIRHERKLFMDFLNLTLGQLIVEVQQSSQN